MSNDLDSPYSLSPAELQRFRAQGFIKLKHVLSPETLAAYGTEITRLTIEHSGPVAALEERDTYHKAFLQVTNLWELSPLVRDFVMSKRLGRLAAELLEVPGVRLYHDQSLYKEPGGGLTPAHVDQYFWPLSNDRTITAWIPLQPVPADMGPLGFFPGSQSIEFGRDLPIGDEGERKICAHLEALGLPLVIEPFELGDVSFHLGWTFHRAGQNISTRPRSVMTIIYMDEAMRLVEPRHEYQRQNRDMWCPGVTAGEVIATAKNPVIFSRAGGGQVASSQEASQWA